MRIEIDTGSATRDELAALIALLGHLRGDEMSAMPATLQPPAPPAPPAATVPPPPPADQAAPAPPAPPASESLIETEAQRAAGAGAAPELDKTGLPYDARIHSSTKAVNNDGTWRNKRGVDPALLTSVTAELRAAAAPLADAPPAPPSPEAAFTPPQQPEVQQPPAPPAPPADQAAPAPPAPPADAPPAPPAADGITYPSIIKAANEKEMTYDQLNGIAVTLGLAAFKDLVKRPDLYESFMAALG